MQRAIFCFGSNLAGFHGAGAARYAMEHFGAKYDQGIGQVGFSYAIPTKNEHNETLPLSEIQKYVEQFIQYATNHPELTFNMTRIGCGLAGYQDQDIAPMFIHAPANVRLPSEWVTYCGKDNHEYINWQY